MKISKTILTVTAGVLFAGVSGMAQTSSQPQKPSTATTAKHAAKADTKPMTRVSSGTIKSIDNDRLVLTHKAKNGKSEDTTYALNSGTEKKGDLKAGSKATVHYRSENNERTATSVQAMPAKGAKK